ncbi:HAD family hydrolase [Wenxinia marina]|uniref:Putative hydrolase (HAD superfamily) n=1 Tax=Wenxinia marina DSM 24838 TaxID=1123501 RepID=A0A0D0QE13_9RHOB|nr:HAD family hydrolase [Wenxinia marina]KIQ70602.1 putative hydrolase (HAD superfamily) [Wenxinia marina DSM 24838]GGL51798.1 haloacid dehalogenase [Wenxinia marina]
MPKSGTGLADWTVGFDADDTLWHNERFFRMTQERFADLLSDHADGPALMERLHAAERRNLGRYGFGIKGFTLSMIETAVEVTEGRVDGRVVGEILAAGREMLAHPIELLPHAREAVEAVAGRARVVLVTKGDLLDQERKLAQSGLGDLFDSVEIVSDKTPATYARIFPGDGARGVMVGNSLRSDVLPAIEAGGWGLYVPHDLTWAYESADEPEAHPRYRRLGSLAEIGAVMDDLAAGSAIRSGH